MSLEFEKETYILRRCFFDVQNEVGRGRQEAAYHQACAIWLEDRGLPVVSKPSHRLLLGGVEVHRLFPDFVCWNAISVELKSVTRRLGQAEFVQLFDYLKCRQDRLGLLVNMGLDRVAIERVVYDPSEPTWVENWESWEGFIDGEDRKIGRAIRQSLRVVYNEHTTGYGDEVVQKLVMASLRKNRLTVSVKPVAKAFYHDVQVDESPLDCLLVNRRFVLILSSLFETNDFNVSRGRSYLKALGLRWGIAADFGKTRAEVIALRRH